MSIVGPNPADQGMGQGAMQPRQVNAPQTRQAPQVLGPQTGPSAGPNIPFGQGGLGGGRRGGGYDGTFGGAVNSAADTIAQSVLQAKAIQMRQAEKAKAERSAAAGQALNAFWQQAAAAEEETASTFQANRMADLQSAQDGHLPPMEFLRRAMDDTRDQARQKYENIRSAMKSGAYTNSYTSGAMKGILSGRYGSQYEDYPDPTAGGDGPLPQDVSPAFKALTGGDPGRMEEVAKQLGGTPTEVNEILKGVPTAEMHAVRSAVFMAQEINNRLSQAKNEIEWNDMRKRLMVADYKLGERGKAGTEQAKLGLGALYQMSPDDVEFTEGDDGVYTVSPESRTKLMDRAKARFGGSIDNAINQGGSPRAVLQTAIGDVARVFDMKEGSSGGFEAGQMGSLMNNVFFSENFSQYSPYSGNADLRLSPGDALFMSAAFNDINRVWQDRIEASKLDDNQKALLTGELAHMQARVAELRQWGSLDLAQKKFMEPIVQGVMDAAGPADLKGRIQGAIAGLAQESPYMNLTFNALNGARIPQVDRLQGTQKAMALTRQAFPAPPPEMVKQGGNIPGGMAGQPMSPQSQPPQQQGAMGGGSTLAQTDEPEMSPDQDDPGRSLMHRAIAGEPGAAGEALQKGAGAAGTWAGDMLGTVTGADLISAKPGQQAPDQKLRNALLSMLYGEDLQGLGEAPQRTQFVTQTGNPLEGLFGNTPEPGPGLPPRPEVTQADKDNAFSQWVGDGGMTWEPLFAEPQEPADMSTDWVMEGRDKLRGGYSPGGAAREIGADENLTPDQIQTLLEILGVAKPVEINRNRPERLRRATGGK